MASAPPAMITLATAILTVFGGEVARRRSVMNCLSSLVAPALLH
jgi:hypothetical protein